jgi:hypothetical protein
MPFIFLLRLIRPCVCTYTFGGSLSEYPETSSVVLQTLKVAVNIINKKSQTADKG